MSLYLTIQSFVYIQPSCNINANLNGGQLYIMENHPPPPPPCCRAGSAYHIPLKFNKWEAKVPPVWTHWASGQPDEVDCVEGLVLNIRWRSLECDDGSMVFCQKIVREYDLSVVLDTLTLFICKKGFLALLDYVSKAQIRPSSVVVVCGIISEVIAWISFKF